MNDNIDTTKGRVKQAAGALTDNPDLTNSGKRDEQAGKAKDAVKRLKDHVDNAIDGVKDRIDRRS